MSYYHQRAVYLLVLCLSAVFCGNAIAALEVGLESHLVDAEIAVDMGHSGPNTSEELRSVNELLLTSMDSASGSGPMPALSVAFRLELALQVATLRENGPQFSSSQLQPPDHIPVLNTLQFFFC